MYGSCKKFVCKDSLSINRTLGISEGDPEDFFSLSLSLYRPSFSFSVFNLSLMTDSTKMTAAFDKKVDQAMMPDMESGSATSLEHNGHGSGNDDRNYYMRLYLMKMPNLVVGVQPVLLRKTI